MSEDKRQIKDGFRVSKRLIAIIAIVSTAIVLGIIVVPKTPLGNDQLCFDYDILVLDGCIDDGVRLDSYYRLVKIYETETNSSSIRVLTYYDKIPGAVSDAKWSLKNIQDAGYKTADFETSNERGVLKYAYTLVKLTDNKTVFQDELVKVKQIGKDTIEKDRWVNEDPHCIMSYIICDSDISTTYHVRLCGTNSLDRHVVCLSEVKKPSGPFGSAIDLK